MFDGIDTYDEGLIRGRMTIYPDDLSEDIEKMATEEFVTKIASVIETFRGEDVRIVLDVYATEHPDPITDDDHEPIGWE